MEIPSIFDHKPKINHGSRLPGMKLTLKQQQVWDLDQDGKTNKEGADFLGISVPVYVKTLGICRKKLGVAVSKGPQGHNGIEYKDPEKAAIILDGLSDPLESIQDLLEQAGLPRDAANGTVKRLKARYFGAITELKVLKTNEIIELLGKKIHLGMQYLDDKVMAEASARDIMLGLGVLLEKRQLLRGEPTQIISDHERKTLHESLPLLMAEMQRRGLTQVVDVQAKEVISAK